MTDPTKIPTFTSREEEAAFWDTHDITDFIDELKPIKTDVAKNLSSAITVRFDADTLAGLRVVAGEHGVGPTTLIRMWVVERLRRTERGRVAEVEPSSLGSSIRTFAAPISSPLELEVGYSSVPFTTSKARNRV